MRKTPTTLERNNVSATQIEANDIPEHLKLKLKNEEKDKALILVRERVSDLEDHKTAM